MARNAWRASGLLTLAACATSARSIDATVPTDIAATSDIVADADESSDATDVSDGGCTATSCGSGQVCVHTWYTHDPPGPSADGAACPDGASFGPVSRYGRCWRVVDNCVPEQVGCDATYSCACPAAPYCPCFSCEVEPGMVVDCYVVGG